MKQIILYGLFVLFPLLLGVAEAGIVADSAQGTGNTALELSEGTEGYNASPSLFENAYGELVLDINHFTSNYKSYIWLNANRKDFRSTALVLCLFKESLPAAFYADPTAYYIYRLRKIVI